MVFEDRLSVQEISVNVEEQGEEELQSMWKKLLCSDRAARTPVTAACPVIEHEVCFTWKCHKAKMPTRSSRARSSWIFGSPRSFMAGGKHRVDASSSILNSNGGREARHTRSDRMPSAEITHVDDSDDRDCIRDIR